jgi:hypothetical protein
VVFIENLFGSGDIHRVFRFLILGKFQQAVHIIADNAGFRMHIAEGIKAV